MRAFTAWILFLLLGAWAVCSVSEANNLMGYGVTTISDGARVRGSFTTGDMHYFYPVPGYEDATRYGYGNNRLNIGNGIGLDIVSRGGAALLPTTTNGELGFQLGVDFANMWLRADTNARSYYGWVPGGSAGVQWGLGGTRFLVLARGGGYGGNQSGTVGFWPQFRASYGTAIYITSENFTVSVDSNAFGSLRMLTGDVYYNFSPECRVGIHSESFDNDTSAGVIWKADLL